MNAAAPAPACHVVFRLSRRADGSETACYEVPDEAVPLDEATWPHWLARRELLGARQLSVPVLVLRETLDLSGLVAECTLERRLGAVDGPFCGNPARVDFAGPARMVRLYRVLRDGQLAQMGLSPQVLPPPAARGAEPFAGELQALERRFGPGLQVLDAREPTLFEDVAGLASIIHIRLPDGRELACGIGWHGTTPIILVADFPRFDVALALPPVEETAVQDALRRLGLVRHETRMDAAGLAVLARRRGGQELLLLRIAGARCSAEPYQPGTAQLGSPDQRGWLRYAEVHEGLKPLDLYAEGASGDLIALTGDASGHVWRHLVDADGVEAWRRPADDAAVAALHREALAPGTLLRLEGPSADPDLARAEQPAEPADAAPGGGDPDGLARELARLRDDLAQIRLMPLQPPWQPPHDAAPFGAEVEARFPDCAYHAEEAASCLAFRRPTAAVFHCMKVVERGLAALGRLLGMDGFPGRVRGWGTIMGAVRPACPPELSPVLGHLQRIRQRWHAPGLDPAEKYTEAEAEQVFQAVDAFMRALAERYDEAGSQGGN
ncbi:MAG TPA: hypothetical protein VFN42_04415 [Acetobacteraceae bacterium]|nr:hypothetical protein [Acetobacteraceae bacterium]